MSQPLVFYDIRNSLPLGQRSWTPNLVKIRLALNYKKIPYRTVWVEFADVQSVGKRIGATPSTFYPDGTPRYTLPTIFDPNTGRVVTDSFAIAKYLDEQYPERNLIREGTLEIQQEFTENANSVIGLDALLPLYLASYNRILLESRNRDALENVVRTYFKVPPFTKHVQSSTETETIFSGYDHLMNALTLIKNKTALEGQSEISFLEIVTVAYLRWLQLALQDDGKFNAFLERDGGKGQKVWNRLKEYLVNDEGEAWVA